MDRYKTLKPSQLHCETERCLKCRAKGCQTSCPANVDPSTFLYAVKDGRPLDFQRAAAMIYAKNPLGAVCGAVCGGAYCMKGCARRLLDAPINIPASQASIIETAAGLNMTPKFERKALTGKKVAVIGASPSGLTAAAFLANAGHEVEVYDAAPVAGGALTKVDAKALPAKLIKLDMDFIESLGVTLKLGENISCSPEDVLGHSDIVVVATGSVAVVSHPSVFYTIDTRFGAASTVVAVAYGKMAASAVMSFLETGKREADVAAPPKKPVSTLEMEYNMEPVSLECEFFGKKLDTPFILSASPLTDGLQLVRDAFDMGWTGVVMKTAFHEIPIHIPSGYMSRFGDNCHGNCDNVSGRDLDEVCSDIKTLMAEYPDKLVIGSTGGPLTGDEEFDRAGWQANTRTIEKSGAHAVEYSLSCPQGGDGSEGAIAGQSAKVSARIVEYILSTPDSNHIPKLFKMTGAVTSIEVIVKAVLAVIARHPDHPAGITLANSFPSADFKPTVREGHLYDDVVVVGSSGSGVRPISNLTLASVSHLTTEDNETPLIISGNGGIDGYRASADFLALGVKTVQLCALPEERGLRVIHDLRSGLSHHLQHL
ncbi:hypothetical protein KIPB_009607, partial [Kipferlia bialata]|eukprot:g9607.t1